MSQHTVHRSLLHTGPPSCRPGKVQQPGQQPFNGCANAKPCQPMKVPTKGTRVSELDVGVKEEGHLSSVFFYITWITGNVSTVCVSDGTKMHCDALGNVQPGNSGSRHSCAHQFDTCHLPEHHSGHHFMTMVHPDGGGFFTL